VIVRSALVAHVRALRVDNHFVPTSVATESTLILMRTEIVAALAGRLHPPGAYCCARRSGSPPRGTPTYSEGRTPQRRS